MDKIISLKIGSKVFEMKLVSWHEGSALLAVDRSETEAVKPHAKRQIIGTRRGTNLRKFAGTTTATAG